MIFSALNTHVFAECLPCNGKNSGLLKVSLLLGDLVGGGGDSGNKRKADEESEGGGNEGGGGGGSGGAAAAVTAAPAPPPKKPKMSAADIKSLPTRQYLDQVHQFRKRQVTKICVRFLCGHKSPGFHVNIYNILSKGLSVLVFTFRNLQSGLKSA